jgi:hypothetical protein
MTDHSVFDMTEDLPATVINVEQVVMTIESSIAGCGVEAGGNQAQSVDSGDCVLERNVIVADLDEE